MATLDPRRVGKELKRIAATSQAVKHLLFETLEFIESQPASFAELTNVPAGVANLGHLSAIRKAKIVHRKHDFRLIFAHWRFEDESEHVDLLLAFRRRDGYEIDWNWVTETLQGR